MTEYLLQESSLCSFSRRAAANRPLLLFLDYDGTLAPFRKNPAEARPLPGITGLLKQLRQKQGLLICVISGRSLSDLGKLLQLTGIYSAGLHGLEINAPDQSRLFQQEILTEVASELSSLQEYLQSGFQPEATPGPEAETALDISQIKIEDKGPVLTLHHQPDTDQDLLRELLLKRINPEKLEIMKGRQIVEIRPRGWNKGRAVELLIRKLNNTHSEDYFPVYLGDDSTDEDAFKYLKEAGPALTVYIKNESPLETAADYYLQNPGEVKVMLQKLNELLS